MSSGIEVTSLEPFPSLDLPAKHLDFAAAPAPLSARASGFRMTVVQGR